jgi:hypothetical protein
MLASALLLSFCIGCAALTSSGCGAFSKPVPVAPQPCTVPTFHVQVPCNNDPICLYTEFALTLQDEQMVDAALNRCLNIRRAR